MATNPLPHAIDDLMTLAEDAADGAAIHETAIGLLQNTETAIRADASGLQTAQTAHLAAQAAKTTLYAAQRSADSNARAFIGMASNVLGNYLGSQWSGTWAETGFPNQSTAVPATIGERQALLASLQTYFTNHAAHANAPLNITAAQAGTLFTTLSDARSAVNNGLADTGQKRGVRNAAQKKLTKRLAGLIAELDQLLEGDDPRWLAFGLHIPDAAVTPEAPSSVVLTLGGPGEVLADWDDVPNADHYRVFKQAVGVDADFVVAGSPSDSDFLIAGVGDGVTLRVKVSAVSGSLESPTSPVAEITLAAGGGAGPVTLSGQWNGVSGVADLSWTGSTSPNVQVYELRGTIGATWDDAVSVLIANYAPGTLGTSTLYGFLSPGDTVTFKVIVHLTTGEQAASNPVTITRM